MINLIERCLGEYIPYSCVTNIVPKLLLMTFTGKTFRFKIFSLTLKHLKKCYVGLKKDRGKLMLLCDCSEIKYIVYREQ